MKQFTPIDDLPKHRHNVYRCCHMHCKINYLLYRSHRIYHHYPPYHPLATGAPNTIWCSNITVSCECCKTATHYAKQHRRRRCSVLYRTKTIKRPMTQLKWLLGILHKQERYELLRGLNCSSKDFPVLSFRILIQLNRSVTENRNRNWIQLVCTVIWMVTPFWA